MSTARHLVVVPCDPSSGARAAARPATMDPMDPMARPTRPRNPGGPHDPVVEALEQAARGDEDAFGVVYDALAATVHGIVLRVVRNPAMAEEVTQEVFVELWRHAPRYDRSRGAPSAWAATVAHRRAVDRVRSEEAARARDEGDARRGARHHDVVVEEVTERLDSEHVVDALAHLTVSQREAVTLAYYGGHTYREVAALLDVPEGTIKTRIRDGLVKLRDLMGVTP